MAQKEQDFPRTPLPARQPDKAPSAVQTSPVGRGRGSPALGRHTNWDWKDGARSAPSISHRRY